MLKAKLTRCPWCVSGNDLYINYHDTEWGVPAYDDATQFEFLILEGAQAGLSWSTILNKRDGYREAFADFDAERMARFGKRDVARLLNNPGIVRNRLKVAAAITNAKAFLEVQRARLQSGDLKAAEIAGDDSDPAAERAAWTLVARAVLNLDEAINKQ